MKHVLRACTVFVSCSLHEFCSTETGTVGNIDTIVNQLLKTVLNLRRLSCFVLICVRWGSFLLDCCIPTDI